MLDTLAAGTAFCCEGALPFFLSRKKGGRCFSSIFRSYISGPDAVCPFARGFRVSSQTLRASMPNRIESKGIAAARFAQKSSSILLDTHILGGQARAEVSPLQARLPLPSPSAVSL
jgi:hypothetical protein